MRYSGNANRSGLFVFECSQCIFVVGSIWLKNGSTNEEMEKFCLVKFLSMPFGIQMNGPHTKCSSCYTFLYIVARPQFCITQCLECLCPKECIPKLFQDFLQVHYSDSIPLSAPAAAARPLWQQSSESTNETVEDWPVRLSALVEKLQQPGYFSLRP